MRSFGMLTARAFWMVRRNTGLDAGSVPPAFTAMVMSFAMRANCFAMRFHRANIVCFLTSKMRPMAPHGASTAPDLPAAGGDGLACRGGRSPRRAIQLRELRPQHAHAAQLQGDAALDLPQFALQVHLFPLLQHRALLLAEPLLL